MYEGEFNYLYSSQMLLGQWNGRRWSGSSTIAVHVWGEWDAHRILVGKREGYLPLWNLGLDGRIILKWKLKKYEGKRFGLDEFGLC